MLLLPFERVVPAEEQNRYLADELCGELPGIFNWALEGLRRLRADEGFIEPSSCVEATNDYRLDCDPTRAFLQEHYRSDPSGSIACKRLYDHYVAWMRDNGHTPLNSSNFGKNVRRVFTTVEVARLGEQNNRRRCYAGLSVT